MLGLCKGGGIQNKHAKTGGGSASHQRRTAEVHEASVLAFCRASPSTGLPVLEVDQKLLHLWETNRVNELATCHKLPSQHGSLAVLTQPLHVDTASCGGTREEVGEGEGEEND